jgi:hypothetical protein
MKRPLSLLFLLLLLAAGCGSDEPVRVRLTPAQTDTYRAMAEEVIDSLRPALDSVCEANFERRVALATDSIVQRRLEEEARLRTRLGQSMPR